jgi:hypothetical protein
VDWSVIWAHGDFLLSEAFVGVCSLFPISSLRYRYPGTPTCGVSVLYVARHGMA